MSATRCTCILDDRLRPVVLDPSCPATRLHLLRHAVDGSPRPGR